MDAHANEYAGAVAAINEAAGIRPLPAEGAEVTGCSGGKRFTGIVQSADPTRIVVEIDGAWIVVRPWEID